MGGRFGGDPRVGDPRPVFPPGPGAVPDLGGGHAEQFRRELARAAQALAAKAVELGGIGAPTSEVTPGAGDGYRRSYEWGNLYWLPGPGAHLVHGAILERYLALDGDAGLLGYPLTDELPCVDGVGRLNHFERGSIYWHPSTGAHEVHGAIRDRYAALGWERWAYPTCDEVDTVEQTGRVNHFRVPGTGEERSIYWTPALGAHDLSGPIRARWASLGWERSYLGYPVADSEETQELRFPPGTLVRGHRARFERGSLVESDGQVSEQADTVTFRSGPITTPSPVGGWLELTVNSAGLWRYNGHFHSSTSLKQYKLVVAAALKVADGDRQVVYAVHDGNLPAGPSDSDWDQRGREEFVRRNWDQVRTAGITWSWNLQGDFTEAVKDIRDFFIALGLAILGKSMEPDDAVRVKACPGGGPGDEGQQIQLYLDGQEPPCP